MDIMSDGPRAYAPFTQQDIQREREEYHNWIDQREAEARQAMDQDLEYINEKTK
jgi:hypothetical protein